MSLFFKHIFRDIKKFPTQPILIILTLVLSVSCAVTAFCTARLFEDHVKALSGADAELGDIIVTAGSSDTRIMFEDDAKSALGESADVLGDFKLTGFSEDGGEKFTVAISATDLAAADRYFEFSYIKYGKFTVENLNSSAVISKSFASKKGLDIGDTLIVSILGKDHSYTVEAIAENTGLLAERDMIVSVDGIIVRLAESVPAIGAISGVMTPYTRLMIKANGSESVETVAEALRAVPEFSGYRIEPTQNSAQKDFLFWVQLGAVFLIASIIILLAAILTSTALKLLESKRRLQYAAFAAAGATRSVINLLRYAESLIYSVVGGFFGILLSVPMTEKIGSLFAWNTEPLGVGIGGIIFGSLFSPALILLCTALHIKRQKPLPLAEQLFSEEDEKSTGEKLSKTELPVLLSLIAICIITIFILPVANRYIPAFILLPLVIRAVYVFIPVIIRSTAKFSADKLLGEKKCRGIPILLARSFENQFALRHVSRLLVILIALIFSVNLCRATLGGVTSSIDNMITSDIAVTGVVGSYADKLRNDPTVDSVAQISILRGTELPYGYTLTSISVSGDVDACLDGELIPDKLPSGHEAVISTGIAGFCEVSVGDPLTVKIKGTEYTLTVSEIIDTGISVLFVDANGLGLGHDAICIKFSDSAHGAAKEALVSKLEANGAVAIEPKYLFGTTSETAKGFMSLLEYATAAAALLSAVGCVNSLAAFYRSRKREFEILRLSGMSRAALARNIALEFILTLTVAFVLAVPICAVLGGVIDTVLRSFGFSIF